MPVILSSNDYDQWLDPGVTRPDRIAELLKPFDARLMRCFPVSERVNRVENDDPECAREVAPKSAIAPTLF
jgi:putative SOS response-associated peptidase YedK